MFSVIDLIIAVLLTVMLTAPITLVLFSRLVTNETEEDDLQEVRNE